MAYKWLSDTLIQRVADMVTFPVDPECREYQEYLRWVDLGNEAAPIAPEPLEQIKARQLAGVNAAAQAAVASQMTVYPEFEQLSWATQERESDAWAAASPADRVAALVPWCATAAAARKDENGEGMALSEFMDRVAGKVAAFKAMSAEVAGKRQGLEDRIMAAQTAAEVEGIAWGTA